MIGCRLKSIRKTLKLTQNEVANILGISQGGYQNYEKGRRAPSLSLLIKLTEHFNINLHFLLTGKGSMFFDSGMTKCPYCGGNIIVKIEKAEN